MLRATIEVPFIAGSLVQGDSGAGETDALAGRVLAVGVPDCEIVAPGVDIMVWVTVRIWLPGSVELFI